MAKASKGDKHVCPNCETRFFDFGNLPATCPKCGTVIEDKKAKGKAKVEPEPEPEVVEDEVEEIEDDLDVDLDDDEDDDDLMEDASDLGGDDDMADVIEHPDGEGDET